jgi:hypothetical protein
MRQQQLDIHAGALQFRIGEIGDQRLLTDGMHRHHIASTPALGDGVVPHDGLAGGATAQPAGDGRRRGLVILALDAFIGIVFGMLAGHGSA